MGALSAAASRHGGTWIDFLSLLVGGQTIRKDIMSLENLYPIVMKYVNGVTAEITDKMSFQCFLGMVVDYWTSTHGGDPHEILDELIGISDQVNVDEGRALPLF